MIKYLTAVFLSVMSFYAVGQPPVILSDSTIFISIGKQIDVLEDPSGKLSLQQILSPQYQSQFKRSTQEVPNFGTKQTSIWSRIKIKSTANRDWVLNVDFPILRSVSLYQANGSGYAEENSGRNFPFSRRKFKNRSFIFELNIKPGEEKEIYLRVENHLCIFPLYIGEMKAISERQQPEDTLYGVFYGICFIISFYAIALFIASREIHYLYYFIQVIFFVLYGMIYCGDASHWFPSFALPLTDYGTVIICTGTIFVWLFFDSVLKTRKRIKTASRLFRVSEILLLIAIILYFAGFRPLAATINMLVSTSVFVYAIYLCFHLRDEKIIRLIFIGFVIGFAILLFWILMLQNILPYSRFNNNLFIVQYTWFMIIFSLALELNITKYIKEKYQAQKESLINLQEKEKLIIHQNEILEQRVEERTRELKETQSQLIQREKMASLGELTAGVAHEIQNPLNFVNNFSEVSSELIDEIKTALNNNNLQEANALATDLNQNLQKITHHGKRADAIVKGMLQHSRASSGFKEDTDINDLVDEYLRLSYQGLRAKDKSFNATLETNYDRALQKINITSQDVGRVILNLFTNAFYSVSVKKKTAKEGYAPTVSVSTRQMKDHIEIRVRDNGSGIPQKVLDKIYQPFFTTKPTGQGTGLGLSLSYDIIKAHHGELKVETKEGEFAEFTILLPLK